VKSAREIGVNLKKTADFLANTGTKASLYQNILHQERKHAIEDLSKECFEENLRDHAIAAHAIPNYHGDMEWTDKYVKAHRTTQGVGSFDGAGLMRSYQHKIKGSQSVLIIFALLTRKPIMVVHMQVCWLV